MNKRKKQAVNSLKEALKAQDYDDWEIEQTEVEA
jgi:hypothetical protein